MENNESVSKLSLKEGRGKQVFFYLQLFANYFLFTVIIIAIAKDICRYSNYVNQIKIQNLNLFHVTCGWYINLFPSCLGWRLVCI